LDRLAHLREGEGRHLVAQARQLLDHRRRQQVAARREDLAHLDEGRAEPLAERDVRAREGAQPAPAAPPAHPPRLAPDPRRRGAGGRRPRAERLWRTWTQVAPSRSQSAPCARAGARSQPSPPRPRIRHASRTNTAAATALAAASWASRTATWSAWRSPV